MISYCTFHLDSNFIPQLLRRENGGKMRRYRRTRAGRGYLFPASLVGTAHDNTLDTPLSTYGDSFELEPFTPRRRLIREANGRGKYVAVL